MTNLEDTIEQIPKQISLSGRDCVKPALEHRSPIQGRRRHENHTYRSKTLLDIAYDNFFFNSFCRNSPFLETVAGDALSTLCGSKMILQFGAMGIRSPFANVSVLLSSRTELRFSIHNVSTGPSSTSQMCSP